MKTLSLLLLFISFSRAYSQRFIGGSIGLNSKMEEVISTEAGIRFGHFTAIVDVRGANAANYGIGGKVGVCGFRDIEEQRMIHLFVGAYYDKFVWNKQNYKVRPAISLRIQDYSAFYELQYSQNTLYFTIGYQWRKKK